MNTRILININNLMYIVAGEDALEAQLTRELKTLADELNSTLPDYEVRLIHLDTDDYLEFIRASDEQFLTDMGVSDDPAD
jgi:hypothetical protein